MKITHLLAMAPLITLLASQVAFANCKKETTPKMISQGKQLYTTNCVTCHGENGDGKGPAAVAMANNPPRSFIEGVYKYRDEKNTLRNDLFKTISNGIPGTPMPPWKDALKPEERCAVAAYVETFNKNKKK